MDRQEGPTTGNCGPLQINSPNCGPPISRSRLYIPTDLQHPDLQPDEMPSLGALAHPELAILDATNARNARRSLQKLLLIRDLHMESASPLASIALDHTRLCGIGLVTIEWSCQTNLRYHFDDETILIEISLHGQSNHRCGHECLSLPQGSGIVLESSRLHQETVRAGYRGLFLRFERASLENRLSALLQRPIRQPLVFAPRLDLASSGQSFWHLLPWLCSELAQPASLLRRNPAIARKMETLLLDMLLASHTSNYSTALAAREPLAIPRHLRAVMAAIQTAPEQAWTLAAMATCAGVSVRTLCEAFRQFHGSTPMEFLRSVRLARTREQLQELGPHASIAAVAKRWGFGHAGRFAAAYAHTFGETPSETLRGKKKAPHDGDAIACKPNAIW